MNSSYIDSITKKLIDFSQANDPIRALVLTSSLCNPNAPADILSDFDIEFFFEDPASFAEHDSWIETIDMGPIMAIWHWPNEWDFEKGDGRRFMRMVYFLDGTKMDISLRYLADLRKISSADSLPDGYDIGYKVLLDKDNATAGIKPPTYQAFILKPPSPEQFKSRVETFWMESTYVAKYLWREDLVALKDRIDKLANYNLREALEWSVAMEHGWNWKPGSLGRGLSKALDHTICQELTDSYAAGDLDDLWESLFRTTALYRKTAIKIAEHLGYPYPHDLDRRVSTYHQTLKNLDRQTGTREELARLLEQSYNNSQH